MNIHYYSQEDGRLITGLPADAGWDIPANATQIAPPANPKNSKKFPYFIDGKWQLNRDAAIDENTKDNHASD